MLFAVLAALLHLFILLRTLPGGQRLAPQMFQAKLARNEHGVRFLRPLTKGIVPLDIPHNTPHPTRAQVMFAGNFRRGLTFRNSALKDRLIAIVGRFIRL